FGGGAQQAVDAAKTAASGATAANDALASLGTASMTVNAATVIINGAVGAGGIPGLAANDNAFAAPVGKVTRQAPAPNKEATTNLPDLSRNPFDLKGATTGGAAKAISLSPQEIVDLKKTVATEWVQSAGDLQGKGIIDTILNRKASGKWGNSITDVVNAKSQ